MNEDLSKILLVGLGIGTFFWIISEENSKERGQRKADRRGGTRTRTLDRMVSREPSGAIELKRKVENESTPILEPTASTMSARRSSTASVGSPTTSTKTRISRTPSNVFPIRKYPDEYYQLNKKQQWKFRQKLDQ